MTCGGTTRSIVDRYSPSHYHAEQAMATGAAGTDILLETPIALQHYH